MTTTESDSAVEAVDPFTAMTPRFGRLTRLFARRFFTGFRFDGNEGETLQQLEREGSVVYVMRYSSRLDYLLFNWVFLAAGVRLSVVANGIRFFYYRPLSESLRLLGHAIYQRMKRGHQGMRENQIELMRCAIGEGKSVFLFLRTDKRRRGWRTRKRVLLSGRSELDYLQEVVEATLESETPVSLVPLALFWRKGSRENSRFLNLFYGSPERPTDTGKVVSFLWNYTNLAVRVGTPINLRNFVDERRETAPERIVTQVRRSLLIFLRREEKPVLGQALRSLSDVESAVMADSGVRRAIEAASEGGKNTRWSLEARARRNLHQIAAKQSNTWLAILDAIVGWMFNRLFARVEILGLDKVVAAAKLHPVVLAPTHRSHFDYLILSWLFYENHLVPPHVAAGDNLTFWPLGPILRRAGGFFLRRSFDGDELYAAVFRAYVQLLIKDGATQEFFIEGGRSRSGKTLVPRLGMLRMIIDAFLRGARRDLTIIPVGFTYEMTVEEGSMSEERSGTAAKEKESVGALLRARRIFRSRFGPVTVRFGEAISLGELLESEGIARGSQSKGDLGVATEHIGQEISRRINDLVTARRSAVSAAALLGDSVCGVRHLDFHARLEEVVSALRLQGAYLSPQLERNLEQRRPEGALKLLMQHRLVERKETPSGALFQFAEDARPRLDYYRTTILPFLAWPAILALSVEEGDAREDVLGRALAWMKCLRLEYFPGSDEAVRERFGKILDHFLARSWVESGSDGGIEIGANGRPWIAFWIAQVRPTLEAYAAVIAAVDNGGGSGIRKELLEQSEQVLKDQLVLGEAKYPESASSVTRGNAVMFLLDDGYLSAENHSNSSKAKLEPGPRWSELKQLRRHLAIALARV